MHRLLLVLIIALGNFLGVVSRTFKLGSGTSAPGYFLEAYFPSLIKLLGKGYEEVIMISGTNGKTTTRALLNKIYQDQNIPIMSNYGGANIFRGIATAFIKNRTWSGDLKSKIAILEVEEATLPKLTKHIPATTLILTNIFRDQLDAYGEIDQTLAYFKTAIKQSHEPKLIINQDDYKLCNFLSDYLDYSIGFGINSTQKPKYENSAKPTKKPSKSYIARDITTKENTSFVLDLNSKHTISSKLPGVFNVYNIMAAISATYDQFGEDIFESIKNFNNVFGRGESITVGNTTYKLFLVKNPAGFEEILHYLLSQNIPNMNITMAINDNTADGKDVSWLWDVDFESFIEKQEFDQVNTSGSRGLDMLLRLEYAGAQVTEKNYIPAPDILNKTKDTGQTQYILCTYTALLEVRKNLSKHTAVQDLNDLSN